MNALADRRSATPATGLAASLSWAEVMSHRGYLVRFAQRRLRDPMLAEDVVHDVFEAVLSGRAAFAGDTITAAGLRRIPCRGPACAGLRTPCGPRIP